MVRRNTLNNMQMENIRRTQAYQAVITDLAIEGVLPVETAETLLGYEIPDFLHDPAGRKVERSKAQPKQQSKKKDTVQAELPIKE